MIGLTAGLTALVGAFGSSFMAVMPILMIAFLGPALTFSFLHKVRQWLNKIVDPNKDKNVEVFYSVNERESKNGKIYYESNGDKFFHKPGSIRMYVIPKDGIPFSTDESYEYFMNDYSKGESSWDRIEGAVRNIEDTLEDQRSEGRRIDTFGKAYDESDSVWLGTHKIK